jgi:hypothetical protein
MTIALVEFKRQRVRRYESPIHLTPGNYVIVEGDRGIDCGLVVHTWTTAPDGTQQHACVEGVNVDMSKVKAEPGRMLRVANQQETSSLHGEIAALEHHALKTCREKALEYGLIIQLLDCEFQFDRKKVTFYFDSNVAIDFRYLVKDLFKTFGARIWMENVNSKVRNAAPPGALSNTEKMALSQTAKSPQLAGGYQQPPAPRGFAQGHQGQHHQGGVAFQRPPQANVGRRYVPNDMEGQQQPYNPSYPSSLQL